ncbi:MAG: hypothetical protein HN741_05885, partial [Anaerolineae bacterium]|nr:hypothetical protein [Anaerolineae bacterium]
LAFITSPPLILAGIAVLAYGILAPQLGFYWDDLPMSWIRYELGQEAFTQYFSTNRPAWGVWYGLLTKFIPHKPVYWQIIALFWYWFSSVIVWGIFAKLFPERKKLALISGLLFLLYTGFNQHPVSFNYGYLFTVYSLYLLSLLAMLWGIKKPRLLYLGLLASALNLIMAEYFFTLDFIRPFLLWIAFQHIADLKERASRVFSTWLPYLILFFAGIAGRSLIFNNQIYEYKLLDNLRAAPLLTIWDLAQTILLSLWTTFILAWSQAFTPPDFELQGKVTITIYLGIVFISFGLVFFALIQKNNTLSEKSKAQSKKNFITTPRTKEALSLIAIGILSALLAGVPFWLTDLPISLAFPASRATFPFMLGSVFFTIGIISLIPRKELQIILFTTLIAFSAGRQFLWADEFRRDWIVQKNLFWQMSWRIPDLEENTLVLMNEGALKFYADNSLSAPLNWIYEPDASADHIPYMVFHPRTRFGVDGENLEEDMPLYHDFIAGEFNGNTDQMLLINFSPPGCLHIIDPEIDSENKFISDILIRNAAPFSRPELILDQGEPTLPEIYAPEPKHGWCYYFQRAELARQRGDWEQAVKLGEKAFDSGDYPNDPTENFVFIEAYAHVNDWENAEQVSTRAKQISPSYMTPLLCPLWERIDSDTSDSPEKKEVLSRVIRDLGCK